ncbi:MAG: hypothetical protein ACRELE_09675 [Gemmatimonadales bacterium]
MMKLTDRGGGDELRRTEAAFVDWANGQEVTVIRGVIERNPPITVCTVDSFEPDELPDRLRGLQRLTPRAIILGVQQLTEADVLSTAEKLENEGADGAVVADVRAFIGHVGHIASLLVDVVVTEPELILRFSCVAEWYDFILDLREQVDTSRVDPEREAREQDRRIWTREKKQEIARQAAIDSRFAQCKTEQARLYLLRNLLGPDAPQEEFILREVARQAKVIYDFEVKPSK